MSTLAEELPKQMARIRDEVIPVYESIGPNGAFTIAMMKADLDAAANASAEGDVVAMMAACKKLQDYKL